MDPLSVIAGVVGISGAAIKASDTLFELVDSVRNAPAEITAISKDTHAFRDVISSLDISLKDRTVTSVISEDENLTEAIQKLEKPLANCQNILKEVDGKLRAHLKPTSGGGYRVSSVDVKWYFVKTGVQDLVSRLDSTKQTLDTQLSVIVLLCNLRAAGRAVDTVPSADTLIPQKQNDVGNDAGSALKVYAASIAPGSPSLLDAMQDKLHLDDYVVVPSSDNPSLGHEEKLENPQEPKLSPLERLQKKENQRAGLHNAAKSGDDLVLELMLEEGTPVDIRASDGKTALHLIAEHGNEAGAIILLDYGADVDATTNSSGNNQERKYNGGRTPLHIAAKCGHLKLAMLLVGRGANLAAMTTSGRSVLQEANFGSNVAVAHYLISAGAPLSTKDDEDWTALHEAALQGLTEVVKTLIEEKGLDVDVRTADHNIWNWGEFKLATPLLLAVAYGHLETMAYLHRSGANIEAGTLEGDQAIHLACWKGHLPIVKYLLGVHIDIEIRDSKYDETPLIKAASTGRTDVILYLLRRGADTRARNLVDRNALLHCQLHQKGKHPEAVYALKKWMQEHGQAEEVKHMLLPEYRDPPPKTSS
ncbi:uncharacterized protein KY384_007547 [Bacidia gigantensis]|uniref:uncharacterized protein n=1 Tax=Bacidia gigantensis TaxID=2732470 RepID=UPI001D05A20D|nr:uncharacterized protein KY384_007547 [Bacidia gigantensis]KAG8527395.1 hypothetical protein KY384_007547 [Bacidia gigantensis]